MKLNLSKTIIISLAFFSISIAWTIYNSYVPVFLSGLIKSSTVVGIIMTIDNVFGILFQPYFGRLSDKTSNRFGRRMPYLLMRNRIWGRMPAFLSRLRKQPLQNNNLQNTVNFWALSAYG